MEYAYDFAMNHVQREGLIALFPSGAGTLCYVTWAKPRVGSVVHRAAFGLDAHGRVLAAIALTNVARQHAGVQA